jgi:hypothetical protein
MDLLEIHCTGRDFMQAARSPTPAAPPQPGQHHPISQARLGECTDFFGLDGRKSRSATGDFASG